MPERLEQIEIPAGLYPAQPHTEPHAIDPLQLAAGELSPDMPDDANEHIGDPIPMPVEPPVAAAGQRAPRRPEAQRREELLQNFRETRDPRALGELVMSYRSLITAILRRIGTVEYPGSPETDDYVQELFLKLHHSLKAEQPAESLSGFVSTIIRNMAIERYRQVRVRQAILAKAVSRNRVSTETTNEEGQFQTVFFVPPGFESVEDTVIMEAAVRVVFDAIPGITGKRGDSASAEDNAWLLRAVFMEGRSYKECAERLGVAEGTVKSRISTLRSRLRKVVPNPISE